MNRERAQKFIEEEAQHEERYGKATDQWLIPTFYRMVHEQEIHLVTTDQFIEKSKSQYNSAWLAREIIQNFVDHNPESPGTLDGVRITEEDLPKSADMPNGGKRFVIEGSWPFKDQTGIISPHSDKPKGKKNSGGNGIGLKQTALRFLRDFDVQKFEIQGEGWTINYGLIKKDDVNQEIQENCSENACPTAIAQHDWLTAEQTKSRNKGSNRYIIETDNPEIIAQLQKLRELGVCADNPYLQGLDLDISIPKSEPNEDDRRIAIKWLGAGEPGRLFVNGQVMNFRKQGESADDYWQGPEGVSIILSGLDYDMSVDRPPIADHKFSGYLIPYISKIETPILEAQLMQTEKLWAGVTHEGYSHEKPGFLLILGYFINSLNFRHDFDKKKFNQHCKDKKYLACDVTINAEEKNNLEKKGYVLCDKIFADIGMPKLSSVMNPESTLAKEKPRHNSLELSQMAEKTGIQVYYEELKDTTPETFFARILSELKKHKPIIEEVEEEQPGTYRMRIPISIDKSLLSHPLLRPKDIPQQILYKIRSYIFHGLKNEIFKDASTTHEKYYTTFATRYDHVSEEETLQARNLTFSGTPDEFIFKFTIDPKYIPQFRSIVDGKQPPSADDTTEVRSPKTSPTGRTRSDIILEQINARDTAIRRPTKKSPMKRFGAWVVGGVIATAALFGAMKEDQPRAQDESAETDDGSHTNKQARAIATGNRGERVFVSPEANPDSLETQIDKLQQLLLSNGYRAQKPESAASKFNKWMSSGNIYEAASGFVNYAPGKTLDSIKAKYRAQGVEPSTHTSNAIEDRINSLANAVDSDSGVDESFQIVEQPTEAELARLGLMRNFFEATLGVKLSGKLFIFEGRGTLGINIGKNAIGLHRALLNGDFQVAAQTFVHELAHNISQSGHGNDFIDAEEALFVESIDKITNIALKAAAGQNLNPTELAILQMTQTWGTIQ